MLSTFILTAVFVGLLLVSVALWAFFLRIGLRWANVPNVTMRRVIVAAVIVQVLQIGLNGLFLLASPSSDTQVIVFALVELAAAAVLSCVVISSVFKSRILRAFQAWLPTLLATVATVAFTLLVLRPYLYESFTVPTNSMAPTLVGQHWQGICSDCGEPTYCSPKDARYSTASPSLGICGNFHVREISDIDRTVHTGDQFIVAKFLTPRRWDIVVFQYPENPSTLYAKRLVGLPGEKITIQDGAVWADGIKQTPPDSIRGIEYLSEIPNWHGLDLWGSLNRPALLGDDEYFVLGDFSAHSRDSRLWERGAPGHSAFAVPKTYMKGVATHTFWPISRFRIHR